MDYKDYYKILSVDKKATQAEIKKAYRALAVKYHPDKNLDDKAAEEQFKLVNEANEVLGNPEKRKQYDELGNNWQNYEQNGNQKRGNSDGHNQRESAGSYDSQSDFSDFFEQFFQNQGQGRTRSQNTKGADYTTDIEITLEEAYQGTTRTIQVDNETLRITTKAGSYNEQQIRIKNKGAKGSSEGNRGDLLVRILVKKYPNLTRKGDDLHLIQILDLYTAVLGGYLIVNTLSGQVKIKISEGTQYGKSIRLKGKGMPIYDKKNLFGDLYLEIHVLIPDKLTDTQRTLFEQLKQTLT